MHFDSDFALNFNHRLRFTRNVFEPSNPLLADTLREGGHLPGRTLVCIDSGVLEAWPNLPTMIERYAMSHPDTFSLAGPIQRIEGGEACKNDQQLQYRLCKVIHDVQLCRQSYLLVIGGGAVLDSVGFAASIAHRGVRLIRMPTTTLSQDDSGVGVKNGINAFGKKNFIGTFAVPWAVLNDIEFLKTQSDRDWMAGFSEAVKVALIKDSVLFERIAAEASAIAARDLDASIPVIERSAKLHLDHITRGGDPFESTTARPLDFGHWAAHKLEQMTYFDLRHGEAVSIGIALDVVYSMLVGMLHEDDMNEILDCMVALGLPIYHEAMRDFDTLIKGMDEFQEHLGGILTITLLTGIGKGVDVHEMNRDKVRQAIDELAARESVAVGV